MRISFDLEQTLFIDINKNDAESKNGLFFGYFPYIPNAEFMMIVIKIGR